MALPFTKKAQLVVVRVSSRVSLPDVLLWNVHPSLNRMNIKQQHRSNFFYKTPLLETSC